MGYDERGYEVAATLTTETIFSSAIVIVKQWGIERYKDFLITSSAVPTFATGFTWYSQGTILRPGRHGSIIEIKRIEGPIFNSKEEAEQHGLELCKDWIDARRY